MTQRPERFRLNRRSPLFRGLVFAGLGGLGFEFTDRFPDASDFGNHGTLTDMDPPSDWVWSPELGRWVIDYDGSGDYIKVPAAITMIGATQITRASWVRYESTITRAIGGHWGGSNDLRSWAWLASRHVDYDITYYAGTSGGYPYGRTNANAITKDVWHHVAVVFDGAGANNESRLKIYVDGVSLPLTFSGTIPNSVETADELPLIGRQSDNLSRDWLGKLGDFLCANRAFSPAEISALADPSNVDLRVGGIPAILPPARRWWPVAVAEEGPTPWLYARRQVRIIGGGMI